MSGYNSYAEQYKSERWLVGVVVGGIHINFAIVVELDMYDMFMRSNVESENGSAPPS